MLFLKRTLPLIITFCTGVIMILAFFSGPGLPRLKALDETFPKWIQIIMTFTMVLGAISLLRINLIKVTRKVEGYGYNLVLVTGFLTMATLGLLAGSWPMFERDFKPGETYYLVEEGRNEANIAKVITADTSESGDLTITVEVEVPPSSNPEKPAGTGPTMKTINVPANRLKSGLGRIFYTLQMLLFHGVFKAAQATMFSLLAFFVASASFRAFRVKSKEAVLLMGAAFVVMLGNVPIGNFVSQAFAAIGLKFIDIAALKEWIMTYPSSAAQSAILIGAMLGYISASMKVILGVERSYLGGES
jgi:hypothetical protein